MYRCIGMGNGVKYTRWHDVTDGIVSWWQGNEDTFYSLLLGLFVVTIFLPEFRVNSMLNNSRKISRNMWKGIAMACICGKASINSVNYNVATHCLPLQSRRWWRFNILELSYVTLSIRMMLYSYYSILMAGFYFNIKWVGLRRRMGLEI